METTARRSGFRREFLAAGTVLALLLMAVCCPPLETQLAATPLAERGNSGETPRGDALNSAGRVSVTGDTHPLRPALEIARRTLQHLRTSVDDYTAILIKRERIGDRLGEHQFMEAKFRPRKLAGEHVVTPLSVYLKFLKPKSSAGREVIWIEGKNRGKLLAHEGGFKNLLTVRLKPDNPLAMFGQRYPITEIGIENLIVKLIEKGERDMQHGECNVRIAAGAKVAERLCTMIQVDHPKRRPYFDFWRARIFIDEELQLPIRYAAWSWPEVEGGEPLLIEEYTYSRLQLNVGLTDRDFDTDNSDYNFP